MIFPNIFIQKNVDLIIGIQSKCWFYSHQFFEILADQFTLNITLMIHLHVLLIESYAFPLSVRQGVNFPPYISYMIGLNLNHIKRSFLRISFMRSRKVLFFDIFLRRLSDFKCSPLTLCRYYLMGVYD